MSYQTHRVITPNGTVYFSVSDESFNFCCGVTEIGEIHLEHKPGKRVELVKDLLHILKSNDPFECEEYGLVDKTSYEWRVGAFVLTDVVGKLKSYTYGFCKEAGLEEMTKFINPKTKKTLTIFQLIRDPEST